MIPQNVSAQILPKTLFGEQYVALQVPQRRRAAADQGRRRRSRRTAPRARSRRRRCSATCCRCCTAVQPAELNATLTAIADGAAGPRRGTRRRRSVSSTATCSSSTRTSSSWSTTSCKLGQGRRRVQRRRAGPACAPCDNLQTSARTIIEKRTRSRQLLTTGDRHVQRAAQLPRRQRAAPDHGRRHSRRRSTRCSRSTRRSSPACSPGSNKLGSRDRARSSATSSPACSIIARRRTTRASTSPASSRSLRHRATGPNCFGLPDNPQPIGQRQLPDPGEVPLPQRRRAR